MKVADVADFYISVLDSLPQQIAVIDAQGIIQWVNHTWKRFAEENGGQPDKIWRGTDYLNVCRNPAESSDHDCGDVFAGIDRVIQGKSPVFFFEYPCHSPTEQRLFMMRIHPLDFDAPRYFVVTHENVTERKLLGVQVEQLDNSP